MKKSDNSVELKAGEDVQSEEAPSPNLDFSEAEVESLNDMIRKSKDTATPKEDVVKEESISETEAQEVQVEDAEPKQEEVVTENVEEVKGKEAFYTADELETLPWEEISQHEDKIPKELKGTYKSMKKAFYTKSEREAALKRESQERIDRLEKLLLEERQYKAEQRKQAEESERRRRLEELDPEERHQQELNHKLSESDRRYEALQKEIQEMKVNRFYDDINHNVDIAIAKLGVKNEKVAEELRRDAMTELPSEFKVSEQSGIPIDFKAVPERVVKKVYDRYISLVQNLIDADPRFEEYKKKWGKEAVNKVIETKKSGATVIKSAPTGNIPKKEPKLPDRITESDFMRLIDEDPQVQAILQEADKSARF